MANKTSAGIALDQVEMEAFCDCVSSYTRELNDLVDGMKAVGSYFVDTENIDGKMMDDVIMAVKKAAQAVDQIRSKTDKLDKVAAKVREVRGIQISTAKKSFAETKALLDKNTLKIKNISAK